jgi:hypothetical protein
MSIAMIPTPAPAAGCPKGAVIGGVAGHYAGHHGLLGAGAGCLIAPHEANTRAREHAEPSGLMIANITKDTAVAARPSKAGTAHANRSDMPTFLPLSAERNVLITDLQLASAPSVFFDAVAVIVSGIATRELMHDAAALDFVWDAFNRLKVIGPVGQTASPAGWYHERIARCRCRDPGRHRPCRQVHRRRQEDARLGRRCATSRSRMRKKSALAKQWLEY